MEDIKAKRQMLVSQREKQIANYEMIRDRKDCDKKKDTLSKSISDLTDEIFALDQKLDKKLKKFYN